MLSLFCKTLQRRQSPKYCKTDIFNCRCICLLSKSKSPGQRLMYDILKLMYCIIYILYFLFDFLGKRDVNRTCKKCRRKRKRKHRRKLLKRYKNDLYYNVNVYSTYARCYNVTSGSTKQTSAIIRRLPDIKEYICLDHTQYVP